MDFLVGFTIFIFSLIVVANMVPSLLVGLQRTIAIDYDAVAYRTAVILVEDPGEPTVPDNYQAHDPTQYRWDSKTPGFLKALMQDSTAVRFGLAVSRESPNILSQRKINLFFDPTFTVEDFRKSLIFGSINYGFNITLTRLDTQQVLTNGTGPYPEGRYGYIRRYVKIKNYTNATITNTTHPEFNATTEYVSANQFQYFRVILEGSGLYKKSESGVDKYIYSPPYVIDPTQDNITVNLHLEQYLNNSQVNGGLYGDWYDHAEDAWKKNCNFDPLDNPADCLLPGDPWYQGRPPNFATLRSIRFTDRSGGPIDLITAGAKVTVFYHDPDPPGTMLPLPDTYLPRPTDPEPSPGVRVGKWLNLTISNIPEAYMDLTKRLDIVYTFGEIPVYTNGGTGTPLYIPRTMLSGTLLYDYNPANVTQTALSSGILEVAIW